ncbi:Aste57867_19900 [Aphanomyces stellatus]|uniref:Aste57867_19900 protein n=1 Tax=Aphanomyces stellatus TaxID=120398 RepID=A0A485LDR2_9STRA|nr:hypothetical protein As57867_019834 [Aphanomyces stellatus]VFT96598.1 Aste57867_19900 [Aphanomyces stellatus]
MTRASQSQVHESDDSDEVEFQPKRAKVASQPNQSQRRPPADEEAPRASDEDDDDLDFTQRGEPHDVAATQPMSQSVDDDDEPARIASMNATTKEDLTVKTVRYLLYKANTHTTIKLGDLAKDIFKDYRNATRHFLGIAAKKLEAIFGYKVLPVDDSLAPGAGKRDVFIIVNSMTDQSHLLKVNKCHGKKERGLLMMILGFIWCAPSRRLDEDNMWKQLTLLDKSIRNQKHPYFGDIPILLKTFESQLYLSSDSEIDPDGKRVKFYTFGPRSLAEVGKAQILTFVCKLVNGRHPSKDLLKELEHEEH